MESEQIVAVHRNHFGDIISFKTSSGRIISYRKAIEEVETGVISGIVVEEPEGTPYLTPATADNFDDFPTMY
ncbi:DUF3892 domain-containing protein [Cytobacillus sp. FJAT-54145]|uniref:DUF3892 domain-containing protein n=1 Tax=Cytobacillus spartinae TaxID=3299023 RepID=A0ABW6KD94_9BACI